LFLAVVIVAVPFPINLAIAPGLAVGVGFLVSPLFGFIALVASVPVQDAGAVSAGVVLTATKLALAGVAATIVLQLLIRGERVRGSRLLFAFALYIGTMFISLFRATSILAGLADIYRWLVALFALVLALYAIRDRRGALLLASAMGAGALAEGLLGVFQSSLNVGPASFAVSTGVSRAFGTFGKPNSYAGYLELTAPFVGSLAIWSGGRLVHAWRAYSSVRLLGMERSEAERRVVFRRLALFAWFSVCTIGGLAGIVTSFSRGAWLGTAAAIGAMVIATGHRARLATGAALLLLVASLAAGGGRYAPAVVRDRFDQLSGQLRFFDSREVVINDENFAAVERMAHWQTGIAMFLAHPVTGVGSGNFNVRFTDFAVNPFFTESRGHAHNYYIHAAAETGLVGLSAYLVFILTALGICINTARSAPTGFGRAVGIGALGVTVALMVHNIVEDLHVLNLGIQLSAVWALAILARDALPGDAALDSKIGTPA
jgi:O-antigen ligase